MIHKMILRNALHDNFRKALQGEVKNLLPIEEKTNRK